MNAESKTLFVTGGAGFIGSNLVRYLLLETNYRVVNIDKLTYAGNLETLSDISSDPRYHFEKVDIVDRQRIRHLFHKYAPVGVLHLAAESHVDRSIEGADQFIETNIIGTYGLVSESQAYFDQLTNEQKAGFRFLHVSTDEVYGSLGPTDSGFKETTAYDPRSPYSASKASSDHLVKAWGITHGLPVLVTNCSNNYGPAQYPEKLIPVVILNCLLDRPIPIFGNGENIRDWIHVNDHCRALHSILKKGKPGESYNIGGDCELRNIDLVKTICRTLDQLAPSDHLSSYQELIQFAPDRKGHDFRYAINNSKIESEIGWHPTANFDQAMTETIAWYLNNRQWWEKILANNKNGNN